MAGNSVTVAMVGSDELAAALRQIAAQAPDLAARVLDNAAMRVEASAKQRCPVDTGRLRSSIQVGGDGLQRTVGTNVEYGPYIEFGTSKRPAKPFLGPAAEQERPKFEAAVEAALNRLGTS